MSSQRAKIPISVLDFCPIRAGETPRDALLQATALAGHVEKLGYHRFWVPEHHNARMAPTSATSVVIAHIAANTSSIRVGSGGVMLPNHAPLIVAEQFGTLASLYPDRIDLGLGRASGTVGKEELASKALRRAPDARERYPSDVRELQAYFRGPVAAQDIQAIPGSGLDVPLWLLGSSTFSAAEAGALGLPFMFATHIGAQVVTEAMATYRAKFQPSEQLGRPYAGICVSVTAADDDETARFLFTSRQRLVLSHMRGVTGMEPLQPPVADMATIATPEELAGLAKASPLGVVGSPAMVAGRLDRLIAETEADEVMVLSLIHDLAARHRCFEILARHEAFTLG